MHVSELHIFPIKTARGIPCDRASLDERGFHHDRRWMLVDADDVFLTQREAPRMALIDVALRSDALVLEAPDMEQLLVPLEADGPLVRCTIWRDIVDSVRVSPAADDWFTRFLGAACSLVYMPDASRRIPAPAPAGSATLR